MTDLKEIALALAVRGIHVFPLRKDSKEPYAGSSGYKDATTDAEKLCEWWHKEPMSNVGIATGSISGFFVVDVDVKGTANGFDSLKTLGDIDALETLAIDTPSGGRHYYFTTDGLDLIKNATNILPGVDVRGDGGYVLAPTSTFGGKPYSWAKPVDVAEIRTLIKPASSWLLDAVVRKASAPREKKRLEFDHELKLKDGSTIKINDAEVGREYRCMCPFHDDREGKANFIRKGANFGLLHCFYCSDTWRAHRTVKKADLQWAELDSNGAPVPCAKNTKVLLNHFGISCHYNEMTKFVEIETASQRFLPDLERNAAIEYVSDCARLVGYNYKTAVSNMILLANENSFHPVRRWVLNSPWDGLDRFEKVYEALKHKPVISTQLKKKLIRRWLRACVALLMHSTEHQSDEHRRRGFLGTEGILVLQGGQGLKKTQFFQSLVPPNTGFFQDGVALDPNNKDSVAQVVSHWIVELGELDSIFRKADVAALRAWLTKKSDEYRPPYAKEMNRYPRRTAVCATVNDEKFLPELGENRRYWIIPVVEVKRLEDIDLQQLWAQAYHEYREGKRFWFEPHERDELYKSNEMFERKPPIIQLLEIHVQDPYAEEEQGGNACDLLGMEAIGDLSTREKKPAAGLIEKLSVSEIHYRLTGRREPSRHESLNLITKWLTDRRFKTATNKHFHVVIVGLPQTISRMFD